MKKYKLRKVQIVSKVGGIGFTTSTEQAIKDVLGKVMSTNDFRALRGEWSSKGYDYSDIEGRVL